MAHPVCLLQVLSMLARHQEGEGHSNPMWVLNSLRRTLRNL
jgi:hypothetical protein